MKNIRKLLSVTAALVFCLLLAACSATPADNEVASEDEVSSVESVESTETTLETMVKSDAFQEQVKTLSESYEAQGMKLEITAEGDTLIYTCSYTVDGVDTEEVKTALEEYLESETMTKSINEVLEYVRKTVPETESVKVVYVGNDGKQIASKEYK